VDYYEIVKNSTNHLDRCKVASAKDCPMDLLRDFIMYDVEFDVVKSAASNLSCTKELLEIARNRFAELKEEKFLEEIEQKKRQYLLLKEISDLEQTYGSLMVNDRDEIIRKHILKENYIDHASSHLGITPEEFKARGYVKFVNPNIPWAETDLFRIAMIIAPAWGVLFPPYNIAKLTGLLRSQKYSVKVLDLNIESYHRLKNLHGEDYWRSERYFLWLDKINFEKYLLPDLKPMFDKIVLNLAIEKPKVVGFSIYNTNFHATLYLLERLKEMLPADTCFIAGGPEMAERYNCNYQLPHEFNYIFVGEAEANLLQFLKEVPNMTTYETGKVVGTTKDSRLNLDVFAYPDYSDYILSNYQERAGISAETSRGCVAQCSFCSETYYWRFRSLSPERTIAEITHQIYNFNINRVWFVDSLINGDLKNFQKLVDLILVKKLKFNWNSYARCDGRMTREFLQKVADSGCNCLSFGVESGSQKILDNMRKKIEVWEIEQNLKDASDAGIFAHINWMVGFPTEEAIDWMHGLQLLFNCRKHIHAISVGYGAGAAPGSHMKEDPDYYGINFSYFLGNWRDEHYTNTQLHRFLRIKLTHIWLAIINKYSSERIADAISYVNLSTFYDIKIGKNILNYSLPDNYVKLPASNFETSIESEYLAFFYVIYKYFGSFSINLKSNPKSDKTAFGKFIASNYTGDVFFEINEIGDYNLKISHSFIHSSPDDAEREEIYRKEREIRDMSFSNERSAQGNIHSWISEESQVKPAINPKRKKIILQNDE
jgi:anaerobic magnesium-protoporphyrin IX monomethyl ester cyclase